MIALLFSACAGEIGGTVYLDENDNQQLDENEKGIERVLYTAMLDSKTMKSGVTGKGGVFRLQTDGALGYWCITVKKTAASYTEPSTQPQIAAPLSGKATSDGTTTTGTVSTETTEDATTTTTTTTPKEPVPVDTVERLKGCVNIENYSEKTAIDIPVSRDYYTSITQLPEPTAIEVGYDESFDLLINFPCSCKLLDLTMPEFIKKKYGGISSTLNLSNVLPTLSDVQSYDITNDAICTVSEQLKVVGSKAKNGQEVSLEPKVTCPDDSILVLQPQKIKISFESGNVTLKQSLTDDNGDNIAPGDILILTTEVKNSNYLDYKDAMLEIVLPSASSITSMPDSNCSNAIEQVSCDIDLKTQSNNTYTLKFKVSDNISQETGFLIKTTLNHIDLGQQIHKELPFTVRMPQTSSQHLNIQNPITAINPKIKKLF